MQRGTRILIWCLMMMSIAAMVVADAVNPATGDPFRYIAPMVDVAPSIDGILDDPAWEMVEPAPIAWNILSQQRWTSEDDFAGVFQAVWRDQVLYVAIRLHDDQVDTASPDVDGKDRLLLYVDVEHIGEKNEQYRYTFPVQEDRTYEYYPKAFAMWGPVDDVCEISFDLNQIPYHQLTIGFSIEYHDVDFNEAPLVISWPPDPEFNTTDGKLGDLVFYTNSQKDPRQISVTWGAIKALF